VCQWIQSVARLHSDFTKFLLSTTVSDATVLPSSTKPTASVVPQMQPNCVTVTTESATTSENAVSMETETDEAETTVSVDTSDLNSSLETLSKESHDTSSSDVDRHNCIVAAEADTESRCCNDIDSAVRRNGLSSHDDCCHSNNVTSVRTEINRCSDYEVASVLSDMRQLATIAAATTSPALSTTFSAGLNTASDTRSTSFSTVDCVPAVPSSSSSCFTNMLGRTSSGQCRHLIICQYVVVVCQYVT